MDAAEVRLIIERRKSDSFDRRLVKVRGTYMFDVAGAGVWRLRVDRGHLEVLEGTGDADCIIHCTAEDFVRLGRGQLHLVTAFMRGRVIVEGNMVMAQILQGILPAPQPEPFAGVTP